MLNKFENCLITLLGNKCDKEKYREVDFDEGAALAKMYGIDYWETSVKNG